MARKRKAAQVAATWQVWVAENIALGASPASLLSALEEEGLTRVEAQSVLVTTAESPLLEAYVEERRKRARRDAVLALTERLGRTTSIERRLTPSADEFFCRYYARNVPCVFTDFTEGWRARSWTPSWLRETFAGVEMEIASARDSDPLPDRHLDRHREKTTVDAYVDRVLAAGTSNDIYTVANNRNMDRPEFARLLDDVVFRPDYFHQDEVRGGTSFWLGPAGTTTPFHHDTTNILFHQLYGAKRFVLAAPTDAALLDEAEGFYSSVDPDAAGEGTHHFEEVFLAPGETLFLPVGYWHKVTALSVSISFSQLNLRRPNAFNEYEPGRLRQRSPQASPRP